MGKKSLTKSTSKKKATKKKGTTKSDAAKADTAQTKTGKTASKKAGTAKKPTLKSLRKKDFGTWTPAVSFSPKPETGAYTAPPAVESTDKESAKEIRALLKKQFETAKPAKKTAAKTAKKAAKPASPKKPAKKTAPRKAPTVKELLQKQFDTTWAPETFFTPEPAEVHFSAPPAIDKSDAEESGRIKALLGKTFDLSETTPSTPAKESGPAKAEESVAPEKDENQTPEPAPQPSVAELLARKFEIWQPEALFHPGPEKAADAEFSAPPIVDKDNEPKFRELISREFDLSKVTPRPPAEPEQAAPAAGEPQPEKPAEPAEQEKAPADKAPEAVQAEARPEPAPAADKPEAKPKAEKPKSGKKETAEKQKAGSAAKSGKSAPKASAKDEKAKQPPQPPAGNGGEPPMPPPPGGPQEPREPMSNALKILIISVAAIFGCIILASALNSSKYYIQPGDAGVEIWKGDFSPRGKEKVVTLEGTKMPPDMGEGAVSRQKAYSLPFDYYMQRAEKLSEKDGVPDFEAIRGELKKAKKYAVTSKQLQKVKNRLNHIEFTFLLNKADMTAGQDSAEGYEKALEYLRQARELTVTQSQKEMVARQMREIQEARKNKKETPPEQGSSSSSD